MEENKTLALCKRARAAVRELIGVDDKKINKALSLMADELIRDTSRILVANALDLDAAKTIISEVMLDRLRLDASRIQAMADGIREIAKLPSPLGRVLESVERPNGLKIDKVTVPIGVIAIIYESRPNVTSDAAALALKSGNVCILKSGKEAHRSAAAIVDAMKRGLRRAGLTEDAVSLVPDVTREGANTLMRATGLVDLLIPRGGAGLIRACVENATVPTLETGTGICHIFVDRDADIEKALSIINNAKTSRPSVCNACEVCLVDADIAEELLPRLRELLVDRRLAEGKTPVELRLDPCAAEIIEGKAAGECDFDTEFLDYILAVKVVSGLSEAIEHIAAHSTRHSEAIITENEAAARVFAAGVDSAAVYINASTRFTDGGEFGLGCEMGISTQKLHARGPLGIRELTTYKYIISGNGQIR